MLETFINPFHSLFDTGNCKSDYSSAISESWQRSRKFPLNARRAMEKRRIWRPSPQMARLRFPAFSGMLFLAMIWLRTAVHSQAVVICEPAGRLLCFSAALAALARNDGIFAVREEQSLSVKIPINR
jgi:hypothetical protein